jgi:hypothetical protein
MKIAYILIRSKDPSGDFDPERLQKAATEETVRQISHALSNRIGFVTGGKKPVTEKGFMNKYMHIFSELGGKFIEEPKS